MRCPEQRLQPLLICNAGTSDTALFSYCVLPVVFLTSNGFFCKLCAAAIALWVELVYLAFLRVLQGAVVGRKGLVGSCWCVASSTPCCSFQHVALKRLLKDSQTRQIWWYHIEKQMGGEKGFQQQLYLQVLLPSGLQNLGAGRGTEKETNHKHLVG